MSVGITESGKQAVKDVYNEGTDIDSELNADIVGEYLFTDADFVNHLSVHHRNLFEYIYDQIKYFSNLVTAGSREARQIEVIKHRFEAAYRAQRKANNGGAGQHSIHTTQNGVKYVKLDGNIFLKADGTEMTPREAYNTLVGKQISLEDGDVITFVKKLPSTDVYKELFKKRPAYEDGIDVDAVSETINKNIVETVTASEARVRNEAQRHPHKGVADFDQRTVYLADDSNAYKLELSIANLTDGTKVAYVKRYIGKAEQGIADEIKKAETTGQTRLNRLSAKSISQNSENVNRQFSLGGVDGVKYSISPKLSDDLDRVLNGTFDASKGEVYLGETSNFMTEVIGAESLKVTMPASKVYSALVTLEEYEKKPFYKKQDNYHGIEKEDFLEILEKSENPVAVFAAPLDENGNSRHNRIILVTDKTIDDVENGGKGYAVVVEEVDTRGMIDGKRLSVNKAITVYPRAQIEADINQAIADGRILDIKTKKDQFSAGVRGSNPQAAIRKTDLTNNIAHFWANVKWENEKNKIFSAEAGGGMTAMQAARVV